MTENYLKDLSKNKLLLVEEAFTVFALMLYSGAFIKLLLGSIESSCEAGDLQPDSEAGLVKLIFTITYAVFLGLLTLRWKRVLYVLDNNKLILLLVGLTLVSCLWSEDFSTTLNRSIALLGTTFFGVYLGSRYPLERLVLLLGWALGLGGILSILFAVGLPSLGTMCSSHEGAWRGIYSHKNILGKAMVLSVTVFVLLLDSQKSKLTAWIGLSGSLMILIFSTSKSSLVIAITILLLLPIYKTLRLQSEVLAPVILSMTILFLGSFILLFSNTESILLSLGRDPTLTGRTELWEHSLEMVKNQIFLGYGYQSFWQGLDSYGGDIWLAIGWEAPHAHNGVIDLALDLGLVGAVVFLAGFLTNLIKAFFWARLSKNLSGLLPLLYLSYLFLANITESTLLERNNIFWVLYVAIALSTFNPPKKSNPDIKVNLDNFSFDSNQDHLITNFTNKH